MNIIVVFVLCLIAGVLYNMYNTYKKMKNLQDGKGKAQEQEDAFAFPPDVVDLYNRAYNYETGYTGLKSMDKAIEFYELAAEKNYPAAQYRLADIYAHGRGGVEVDLAKARKYASQAAAREYPGSDALYQYIEEKIKLEPKE
ncbi:hypothetical protein CKF54_05890 [Psittacicella hinzii]|uniref:Sel1 repeat family protein n=1 Tax=Psittacicella hinzii TaxID=2028575 RepID=A0A3A1Y3G9_9GAMM|nr:SEL1-like repeat protein [Psittacicella hinzii]RIY31970.1 hypothetical protein CKF54_05890 [Psittacicella hinzii]